MAMNHQEKTLFHSNFRFLFEKLDVTYYQAKYGKGESECFAVESLPSYAVLSKCQNDEDYMPSPTVLKKLCYFFNQNIVGAPPVDSWRLTHEDLTAYSDFYQKSGIKLDRRLVGTYWGFYPSSLTSGGISAAILTIVEQGGVLRASMVNGIHTDEELYHPALEQLLLNAPVDSKSFFSCLRTLGSRANRLYCYEGTVEVSDRSVLIAPLRSFDNPPQKLVLTLDITDLPPRRKSYLGGAALMLSTSDIVGTRAYHMGLIRHNTQGRHLSLSDERLPGLLAFRTNGMDCRVDKLDKVWYELAVHISSEP